MKRLTIHSSEKMYGADISHTIDFDCQLTSSVVIDNSDASDRASACYYSWNEAISVTMNSLEIKISAAQAKKLLEDLPEAIEEAEAPEDD
tara:strand:+ start:168 stop:437 length:270 start_codon:yes stop_codon:yes gene_type:complete